MKRVNALVAVALALGCGSVQAGLVNPGFEEPGGFSGGSIDGWTANTTGGGFDVVQSHTSFANPPDGGPNPAPTPPYPANYPYEYTPPQGDWFLMIGSGDSAFIDPTDPTAVWQTVSQMVDLTAGEMLSGYAAFDRDDTGLYLDAAKVSILNAADKEIATPFYMDGGSPLLNPFLPTMSDYGNGPWTLWSWTAPATGTYTLVYAVANTVDNNLNSYGYFDTVPAAVPEPISLALFAIGLAGLGTMQRRKPVTLSRFS